MATKTFEELKQMAIQIRDEKANKHNTATRIGTQMLEHLTKLEQDYYDKGIIDEQNKENDRKLSELGTNRYSFIPTESTSSFDVEIPSSFGGAEAYFLLSYGKASFKVRVAFILSDGSTPTSDYFNFEELKRIKIPINTKKLRFAIAKENVSEGTSFGISFQIVNSFYDKEYKEPIETLKNGGAYEKEIKGDDFTIIDYGIDYTTGKLAPYEAWQALPFTDISKVTDENIKVKCTPGNNFGLAFYAEQDESTFISGTKNFNINTYTDVSIPQDANFFRACLITANKEKVSIKFKEISDGVIETEAKLDNVIADVKGIDKRLSSYEKVGEAEAAINGSDFTIDNYGIKFETGQLLPYEGWIALDFTYLGTGKKRKMSVRCTPGFTYGLAFYKEASESTFISGTKDFNISTYSEISIPDNANYFRIGAIKDKIGQVSILYRLKVMPLAKGLLQIEKNTNAIENIQQENEILKKGSIGTAYSIGKVFINKSDKIVLSGASFAYNANGWFELMCSKLGVTGLNKAISGTRINQLATAIYNKTFVTDEEIKQIGLLMIMHVHNYDVYTLPQKYIDFTWKDYEDEPGSDNIITNGMGSTDIAYAKSYDYVIKKWFQLNKDLKDADGVYKGTTFGRNPKIVFCTHWHDGRKKFNEAIRKLSNKWGIPLVRFDDNIGMSCEAMTQNIQADDGTKLRDIVQFALQSNEGGKKPTVINGKDYNTEVIDGVILPWHQDRGQDKEIQKRMAFVAKELIGVE